MVLRRAKAVARNEKLSEQITKKSNNAGKRSEEVEKAIESLERGLKRKRNANSAQKDDIEEKRFKSI